MTNDWSAVVRRQRKDLTPMAEELEAVRKVFDEMFAAGSFAGTPVPADPIRQLAQDTGD